MAAAEVTNNSIGSIAEMNEAVAAVNPIITNIITAIIIVLIGFIVGRILKSIIAKLLSLVELDRIMRKRLHIRFSLEKAIAALIAYFVYVISIIMALNRLAITTKVITTIMILLIVVFILFLVFGLNDLFGNFFAGFYVRLHKGQARERKSLSRMYYKQQRFKDRP